jgi:hypothetical protein
MNAAQFKAKWAKYAGKESAAYQEHFNDLCRSLSQPTVTSLHNERPAWLDLAHRRLDAAVAAAYGWPADLADEQVLERLLALNLERADAERRAGPVGKRGNRAKRDDEML